MAASGATGVGTRPGSNLSRCACNCGASLLLKDARGRPRRFVWGHWRKGTKGPYTADGKHWRTARDRARSLTDHSRCMWISIGGCKGPIDVAHVNGDYTNNEPDNRLALCRSHHRLLDNGRINPDNPIMPAFYVDSSGNRRYTPRKKESKRATRNPPRNKG